MAREKSVWGIDIGQCALKALKLTQVEGEVRVEAFEVIEYSQLLSRPDVDRKAMIHEALERFLVTQSLSACELAISVPGQSSFTRFVKLPPVEKKKVPDIVRFEAEQQIPFPIDEVIWEWQAFEDPDSPDVEVGLFAMKRVDVDEMLEGFTNMAMRVDYVQMAPLSLYNFMTCDDQVADGGATLLADVGADKTDLVVADGPRLWTRTIQIGGNSFTESLVRAFKLSFEKAEKLKRTAATSKYARQIFHAMRPVFADLVQEIQRSIGYYTSLHRETRFKKLVGLGNGFRLPGLQKFLEQNLNIPVSRVDTYNNIHVSESVNAPQFSENVLSFAVSYGLAMQGLGGVTVETNLLPGEIVRKREWKRKRVWFAAAAAVLLACLWGPIYRAGADAETLDAGLPMLHQAEKVSKDLEDLYTEREKIKESEITTDTQLRDVSLELFGHRNFWPLLQGMVFRAIESVATDQPKMSEYAANMELLQEMREDLGKAKESGATDTAVKDLQDEIDALRTDMSVFEQTLRKRRKVVVLEEWMSRYEPDLAKAPNPLDLKKAKVKRRDTEMVSMVQPGMGSSTSGRQPRGKKKPQPKRPTIRRGFLIRLVIRTHLTEDSVVPQIVTPLQVALTKLMKEDDQTKKIMEFSLAKAPKFQLLPSLGQDKTVGKAGRTRKRAGFMPDMREGGPVGRARPKAKSDGGEDDGEIEFPDPILEKESMGEDARFAIGLSVAIDLKSKGLALPGDEKTGEKPKAAGKGKKSPTPASGQKKTMKKAPK